MRSTNLVNGAVKWKNFYLTPSSSISFYAPSCLLVRIHDKGNLLMSGAINFIQQLAISRWTTGTEHTLITSLQEGGNSSPLQRATHTHLEVFWLFLPSLAFPEAPDVDLHHRQDPIWTQDQTAQSSDTWKSTLVALFLPTPSFSFFFISLLSTAFSVYLFPAKQGLLRSHSQILVLLPICSSVPPQHKAAEHRHFGFLSHGSLSAAILK